MYPSYRDSIQSFFPIPKAIRRMLLSEIIPGLIGAVLVVQILSCGGPSIEQGLQDPARTLRVTVESEPSGAEVYGIKGDKAGTLLGTTPFTCSYMVTNSPSRPILWGSVPVEETIEGNFDIPGLSIGESSYYTFKCLVVKEGCKPARVLKDLAVDKPYTFTNFSTSDVFKGGRKISIMVSLPPLDEIPADGVDSGAVQE